MAAEREKVFYTEVRSAAKQLWDAYHNLLDKQNEWNALDYTNTLDAGSGPNDGYTKTEVSAMIFDTINEIKLRIFDTAHKTNIAKLL